MDQYPVFFEVSHLDAEKKEKIEKYFQIRRKSGGGECGPVEKVHNNVCKLAFNSPEDQERVLQRREHVVELRGGSLTLTVRRSQEESGLTPGPQTSRSLPESTSASVHQEHNVPLDPYLLQYVRETPGAERDLQQWLSSLGCSLQLPLEDGGPTALVVRGSAGDDGGVRGGWREQVDTLFREMYICHYEVEPKKIQGLLGMRSRQGVGVGVYSEVGQGFAVVVGEAALVQARILEVTEQVKGQGSGARQERVSTVCRLGQAKLRLVGEGLEREVGAVAPGVTVARQEPGQLVLEGPAAEVLKARECVSKMDAQVEERLVTGVSSLLVAFLRGAYGGPGDLADLLGLRGQVEVELGDTELRLLTLDPDKLAAAEGALLRMFREEKIKVPNDSALPPELRSRLEAELSEANPDGRRRAAVRYGPGGLVQILGLAERVLELRALVEEFLIDQSRAEETVGLPFAEMLDHLPELLDRLGLEHQGVTLTPASAPASSGRPSVVLSGPSGLVTKFRGLLVPALSSLVREKVTIDQPGAVRYFQDQGKEYLQVLGRAQHSLILLERPAVLSAPVPTGNREARSEKVPAASYRLPSGLRVVVRQGDIARERADALVNAANEDLDPDRGGGVAAALYCAGGPEVRRASLALARQIGKVAPGTAVETTGGDLDCKALLHAVAPVAGRVGGRERALLERTAAAALALADTMELESLAMPCIGLGAFGVPLAVCAEGVAVALADFGRSPRDLTRVTLVNLNGEAVRAMQEACDRLLLQGGGERESGDAAEASVRVEVVQGSVEAQQVDALVSPMLGIDPTSSRLGRALCEAVGPGLDASFSKEVDPGDLVLVKGPTGLGCGQVFFISCARWDGNPKGPAAQALRQGIREVLQSCENRGFGSVAFPVLGPGAVLGFPHDEAAKVLLEEIRGHQQNRASRTPFLIRIVILPSDKKSAKAFKSSQGALRLRGLTIDANLDQASPSASTSPISSTPDEVTVMVGVVKLQLVSGDITRENTDVIVNTVDLSKPNETDVSKAILAAAGPSVQAELQRVGVPPDYMVSTGPGALACKEVVHASFWCDLQKIRRTCGKILRQCERKGHRSVAFPAVNTGAGGVDCSEVCRAMVEGIVSTVTALSPKALSLVRIVILQRPVFQAFRSELESGPVETIALPLTLKEKAQQVLKKTLKIRSSSSASSTSSSSSSTSSSSHPSAPPGFTVAPWRSPPAVLCVVGPGPEAVQGARAGLESVLLEQLIRREVEGTDLWTLEAPELGAVQDKARALGVSLEPAGVPRRGAGAKSGTGPGGGAEAVYVLRGLKEDVLSVRELLDQALSGALRRDLQECDEALVALSVQWSMLGPREVWIELGLGANYLLEQAHRESRVSAEVESPDGGMVKVNLRTNLATDWQTGRTYKVKREENASKLPASWEPMDEGETLRRVQLPPTSEEYQTVAQGFQKTASNFTIHKIERVQSVFLWQAYALCWQRMTAKNGAGAVGEKTLYHGTAQPNCTSIEKSGFNRSFATTTAFGVGVYFAVSAVYSAKGYCSPDGAGLKRMYAARVLTGRHTPGNPKMKVTPPRSTSDPSDRFDSLVNDQQAPAIFVVFHDDQAYPEYLITFS